MAGLARYIDTPSKVAACGSRGPVFIYKSESKPSTISIIMSSTTSSKVLGGRVAIVGTGSRAAMFVRSIVARPSSSVVALCEPNSIRAAYYNELLQSLGAPQVPVYQPEQFKEMLQKEKVEILVVTCIDSLHHLYIIPALEAGGM